MGSEAAQKFMKDKRHRRAHQPYDPNNLNPHFKAHPDNKPRLHKHQFHEAGLYSNPMPMFAALGDFKYDNLPSATNPAYLAATPEVTLTQAIKDQAAALDYSPVKIYDWVRNHVQWLPTWGAFQSADMTLSTQRGNAMDIASLTIALLRASGIPSRYVYGTIEVPADKFINWVGDFANVNAAQQYASTGGIPTGSVISGGKVTKIRLEHVWVEAAVDYFPSRAAVNRSADAWIPMDPSYKQYTDQQGLDVAAITGIDGQALADSFAQSGTVDDADGYVQGLDPTIIQNAEQQAQQKLQDYITNNMTNPTVGDVIGGRRVIVKSYPTLSASLPNHVVVVGARYAELPDKLRNFMTFSLGKDILGEPTNPVRFPWAQVNNERITLSFRPATDADKQALEALLPDGDITDLSQLPSSIPAYLISVIPELKLNGKVVASGDPMNLGDELDFVFQVTRPNETRAPYTYKVIAGSYLAIASIGQGVAVSRLSALKARLQATQNTLQSQDQTQIAALTREDILGDMFQAGVLGYFAEYAALSHVIALQQRAGQSLAIGYGSFGYEPNVTYFFGVPRSIEAGGAVMNIRYGNFVTTHTNDHDQEVQLNEQLGLLSSTLESAVPEQMFVTPDHPGEAISAVKALAKAAQAGQRIYHITQANMASVLPNIHQSDKVMGEIRDALASGKDVITHTNAVSVPGWVGAGYIIIDPHTGIGAYKIGGGANGSYLTGLFLGMALAVLAVMAISFSGGLALPLLASVLVHASLFELFLTIDSGGANKACFFAGLAAGLLAPLSAVLISGFGSAKAIVGTLAAILGYSYPLLDLDGSRAECGL